MNEFIDRRSVLKQLSAAAGISSLASLGGASKTSSLESFKNIIEKGQKERKKAENQINNAFQGVNFPRKKDWMWMK